MRLPYGQGGHQRLDAVRKRGMGGKGPGVHRLDRCRPGEERSREDHCEPHAFGSGRAAFGKNSCSPLIW